jgi:hypothetical protein
MWGTLAVKRVYLICQNWQLDARKICICFTVVRVANAQPLVHSAPLIVIAERPKNYNLAEFLQL